MPTNDAELAAACAALPPTERAKLDWTAEVDDEDAAKSASALSEAFVAAQKDLTVTQRRAAFSTLVREVVLEGDMAFDGAPLRLLEALARGLADKGKYKRENGRDAVSGLITLLRRVAGLRSFNQGRRAGLRWTCLGRCGLPGLDPARDERRARGRRESFADVKTGGGEVDRRGASTEAVRACVGGDANGALAAAALVERGAPVADARAAMAACVAHEGDAWALAAATLAAAFARRAGGRRVAARPASRRGPRPHQMPRPRASRGRAPGKCCRGGTLPEADAADVLMERLRHLRRSYDLGGLLPRGARRRPRGATTRGPSRRWRDVQRRWRRF